MSARVVLLIGALALAACSSGGDSDVAPSTAARSTSSTSTTTTTVRGPKTKATSPALLPERFDPKQVVVTPAGADGLRIREVVDQDFGSTARHGYQRILPHDLGVPTEIEASSPDAPADLDVVSDEHETRIRVGDPAVSITGQHRYVLSYTLPEARIGSGRLALDVIGNDDALETTRFEIVVTGFRLDDLTCSSGDAGDVDGCSLVRRGERYTAVIAPLRPFDGITIGGRIVAATAPEDIPLPKLPPRR